MINLLNYKPTITLDYNLFIKSELPIKTLELWLNQVDYIYCVFDSEHLDTVYNYLVNKQAKPKFNDYDQFVLYYDKANKFAHSRNLWTYFKSKLKVLCPQFTVKPREIIFILNQDTLEIILK